MTQQITNETREAEQEEVDLLMEQFKQLVQEIDSHGSRMREADDEAMTPAALNNELADTVMSLMLDLAEKTYAALAETRDFVNTELAPAVSEMMEEQEKEGDDEEPESVLLPEDAAEFAALLAASRESLIGGLPSVPEEARPAIMALAVRMERALARLLDITLEEDEDEDEDEDETPVKPNGVS